MEKKPGGAKRGGKKKNGLRVCNSQTLTPYENW
jgi:hypothetical protein